MTELIIWGTGEFANQVFNYNRRDNLYHIVGFIDDYKTGLFNNLPIYSFNEFKSKFGIKNISVFVAIGYTKSNIHREKVCNQLSSYGYQTINYISPYSRCWDNTIEGRNIFIADNVYIGMGCKIESGNIILEGCTLCHDITLNPYSFLSAEVTIGGHVVISKNCFIGLNATIKSGITIGSYNIIGSGANVIKSHSSYNVIVGNPATILKHNDLDVSI